MSETRNATIRVRQVKKGLQAIIGVTSKKGEEVVVVLSPAHLSPVLAELFKQNLTSLAGVAVEYEWAGGQVRKMCRAGETWKEPAPTPAAQKPSPEEGSMFENPYNFVPAPPRKATGTDLDDAPPAGQHRYHRGRWSGRIGVRLTTITPLLIPDAARSRGAKQDESADPRHRVFGLRLDPDGVPYLPPTSVKGMLRAAYEAVTNSRMGVFAGHEEPLAFRMDPHEGLRMVPAQIKQSGDGGYQVQLLPGSSRMLPATGEPDGPNESMPRGKGKTKKVPIMYAAWVGAYAAHQYNLGLSLQKWDGKKVLAFITKWRHSSPDFYFWQVEALFPSSHSRLADNDVPKLVCENWRKARRLDKSEGHWVEGYLYVTNRNIGGRHHERLFFVDDGRREDSDLRIVLSPDAFKSSKARWKRLIRDYQAQRSEEDLWAREDDHHHKRPPEWYIGDGPGKTAWSPHIYHDGKPRRDNKESQPDAAILKEDTLCYAKVKKSGSSWQLQGLYPVTISRDLYCCAPHELLDDTLLPAVGPGNFSPADRVFGWVKQSGRGAWRGQLRVGPVKCEQGKAAIEGFDGDGVALAILGQPKPQQARFYAAENKGGAPLASNRRKGGGYKNPKTDGLRGRKIYPHQRQTLVSNYWKADGSDISAFAERFEEREVWPEFMQQPNPDKNNQTRSSQNRSVTQWVKPKMEFTFDVRVENLSELELGVLLWLATLGPGLYLRLGGGKPLGFGSVQLGLTGLDLRDGAALADDYGRLLERGGGGQRMLVDTDLAKCSGVRRAIQCFEDAVGHHYGNGCFLDAPFIRAFVNACRGGSLPVHYPRVGEKPNGKGENFKWFGENEKKGCRRYALPSLDQDDRGLPDYET